VIWLDVIPEFGQSQGGPYTFNTTSSQYCVDALYFGNETRYINDALHSNRSNNVVAPYVVNEFNAYCICAMYIVCV